MDLTKDFIKTKRPCADGFRWFLRHCQDGSNYQDLLDALVEDATARIAPLPWPLDVAVLGMGEDAHTASLFPGAPGYARAIATDQRLAWVVPDTAPHARISFTLSALLAARELVLSITGESKLAVYRRAAQKADEALPISLVINQTQTPLSVWMN